MELNEDSFGLPCKFSELFFSWDASPLSSIQCYHRRKHRFKVMSHVATPFYFCEMLISDDCLIYEKYISKLW